jgi:hypothetical protein
MKANNLVAVASAIIGSLAVSTECSAAQWVTGIPATQVVVGNAGGEYLQILSSNAISNPAACSTADSYIIRDPAIVKSAIAIGLAALASGRQIRVYVTDSCDAPTGRPLATSIGLM